RAGVSQRDDVPPCRADLSTHRDARCEVPLDIAGDSEAVVEEAIGRPRESDRATDADHPCVRHARPRRNARRRPRGWTPLPGPPLSFGGACRGEKNDEWKNEEGGKSSHGREG